ncbi:MAG: LOG family protein [Ignavibacteriaceae bacterium]|nr:LOG family protein [Ignavibacteriaceae bacterium]
MRKVITVFGSSKSREGDEEYAIAYNLGILLAKNGFDVCTGGFMGTMEAISKGANENGAEVIGVTVDIWSNDPNKFITREVKCDNLLERVNKLIELGDAFIVLQGGTGTLLELAAVWELSNKGLMDYRPILCHSSMWQGIVSIMNTQMKKEERATELVKSFETIEEIVDYLL